MNPMQSIYIPLGGGVDGTSPPTNMNPGRLRIGLNIESKPGGGYRRMLGYTEYDSAEVPGEGVIRGVHYYKGKAYAFRNVSGGASCTMYSSSGSGWTAEKAGLAPDGTYRLINYAFSGDTKMYGASGVHKAFQWDGTTWTDITTGMATDEPEHIAGHKGHLFLSFGASVQNSSLGDPTNWTPVTGASEILKNNPITGFSTMPNGALGIWTERSITLLSGSSSADFVATNTVEYGNNAGALAGTIQGMGSQVRFCDSRGITDLAASDASSDFYDAIISHDMDKKIQGRWTRAISSTVVRTKQQYRLFFNDGSGLILVFNGRNVMISQIQFPNVVRCCHNTETASGTELILFGSDNGYVYRMESGNSFAGAAIDAYAETAFTDCKMRHNVKRFRRCRVEVDDLGGTLVSLEPRFYVEDGDLGEVGSSSLEMSSGSGSILGQAILGQAILGGSPVAEGDVDIEGIAKWIGLRFASSSATGNPWEIDGVSIDFFPGRKQR